MHDMKENKDRKDAAIVIKTVEAFYGLPAGPLLKRDRRHSVSRPRFIAMVFMRRWLEMKIKDIAAIFGVSNKMISHAGKATRDWRETEPKGAVEYERVWAAVIHDIKTRKDRA